MISVIIPVYNVAPFLKRCLDSVLVQEGVSEILLIDDGSTDESGRLCDAFAASDPRIQVLHKENGGLSSARNAGLDLAGGEYVAFVDSDDFLEPDTYREMLACARRNRADLVCAGRYDLDGGTGEKQKGLCPEKEERITGAQFVGRMFTWQGCDSAAWDKLYRRTLFDGLRYPQGKICEDVPVTYRAALKAGSAALLPKCLYNYYHRPGSITTAPVSEKSFDFSRHMDDVCRDIAGRAPEILPEARSLRVWSLAHPMMLCQQQGKAGQFREEYRRCEKALRRELPFVLFSPLFSKKQKLHDTLLSLGLFGPFWRLYTLRRNP